MRDYLTATEILALHQALLQRYGGAPGIRDMGAVEAAVFRPQCGYYNDGSSERSVLVIANRCSSPRFPATALARWAAPPPLGNYFITKNLSSFSGDERI